MCESECALRHTMKSGKPVIGRTGYVDARMGYANAMGYISILLAIAFTVYFFRKLTTARNSLGMGD